MTFSPKQKVVLKDFLSTLVSIVKGIVACILGAATVYTVVNLLVSQPIPDIAMILTIITVVIIALWILASIYCTIYWFFCICALTGEDWYNYVKYNTVPDKLKNTKRYKFYKFLKEVF